MSLLSLFNQGGSLKKKAYKIAQSESEQRGYNSKKED